MATLVYLSLRLFTDFGANFDFDTYIFLVVLALDSNTLLRWCIWRSSGR